jgi:protein-tyrosine phosphatase
MIDIHCHIIPGVDDGAASIAESEEMLAQAEKAGVSTIIATPHFKKDLYENGTIGNHFILAKREAEKHNISLLLGYEIKIQNYQAQMPADYEGLTLNGSRYTLFELPFERIPEYTIDFLYEQQLKKNIPILAHPERCLKLVREPLLFTEIIESGCLIQVDAASIIGVNGRKAKRFAKKIITKGYVSFIASDAHNPEGYSKWYTKAYKKVQKWIGKQKAERLFCGEYYFQEKV